MVLNVHRNHGLIGVCVCVCVWGGVMELGEREFIYYRYTVTTRMTSAALTEMGSNERDFNVS